MLMQGNEDRETMHWKKIDNSLWKPLPRSLSQPWAVFLVPLLFISSALIRSPTESLIMILMVIKLGSCFLYTLCHPSTHKTWHLYQATKDPTLAFTSPSAWGSIVLLISSWLLLELRDKACYFLRLWAKSNRFLKILQRPTEVKEQL